MSLKISAMPAAGPLTGTEPVPVVQSGANKKTTTQAIANLAPAGPPPTQIANGGASVLCSALGAINAVDGGNRDTTFTGTQGALIQMQSGGQININAGFGFLMRLAANGGFLFIGNVGNAQLVDASGASAFVTYVPAVPANWIAPVPTDLAAAIDRCAAAIVARTVGGPI